MREEIPPPISYPVVIPHRRSPFVSSSHERWMASNERNQVSTTSPPPVSRIAAMNLPAYRVEGSGARSGAIWI